MCTVRLYLGQNTFFRVTYRRGRAFCITSIRDRRYLNEKRKQGGASVAASSCALDLSMLPVPTVLLRDMILAQ